MFLITNFAFATQLNMLKGYEAWEFRSARPKIEINIASVNADCKMSQVSQLSLFTKVLTMSLHVLCLHPVLCSVSENFIYVNTNYHKLHFACCPSLCIPQYTQVFMHSTTHQPLVQCSLLLGRRVLPPRQRQQLPLKWQQLLQLEEIPCRLWIPQDSFFSLQLLH